MADQVQDSLLREIDEELRQEHYAKLWKKYGNYIIAFAVILVASVAGYQGWRTWDARARMEQSDRFQAAIGLEQSGDSEAARKAFAELADDADAGYATLARLQEAATLEDSGDRQGAIAIYREIAGDSSLKDRYRDLAIIKGGLLEANDTDPAELTARLAPLTADDNPWRYSALEITGFLAYRANDTDKAREIYGKLANDAAAPQGIRGRAAEMLVILG